MTIAWYLTVSALIFAIGAGGVLVRRNPLVVLLCLELMLNAANLALIGFSKMWGNADGQIFALIVMVVAACEVTVGLGVIVELTLEEGRAGGGAVADGDAPANLAVLVADDNLLVVAELERVGCLLYTSRCV